MAHIQLLIGLLRRALPGGTDTQWNMSCTPEQLADVYTLAKEHDLAHMAGQGTQGLALPECEALAKLQEASMQALYRYIQLNFEYESVCALLEQTGIPFIPLKGSVLRSFYPEPWMRTSCDMDILVRKEDLDRAAEALRTQLSYVDDGNSAHDIGLKSPSGVILELHFSLIEDFVSKAAQEILDGVWEQAQPVPGKTWHLALSDELFYFYHMAHMAKHFVHGGCGIRTFLDVWVLNERVSHDRQKRLALLEQGGLQDFALAAEKLSRVWFGGEDQDALTKALEDFVISGGTFGTLQNRVTLNQTKEGGKFRYAMSRIFLPYDILKHYYPILQKHKWLTPLYEVIRWCKLLFCGGVKRSVRELQVNAAVSDDGEATLARLLEGLGLEE